MKIHLSNEDMNYRGAIKDLVDQEIIYNPNFNGVEYEIYSNNDTYIEDIEEYAGAILLARIHERIDALRN